MNKLMVMTLATACAMTSALVVGAADLASRVKADFKDYEKRPFVHYAVPPMSDVQRLPDAYPTDGTANGTVKIHAAKGEYEPGSFLVWGVRDLGKVKFEIGDLKQVEKIGGGGEKIFPKENLDLKVVKCWYQNLNGWFSYFPDSGDWKLCPELLLNDEDLIRCDTAKKANYARIEVGSRNEELGSRNKEGGGGDDRYSWRWINPPREMDEHVSTQRFWMRRSAFNYMQPGFHDAKTLQPVTVAKNEFRNFFLTAHVTKDIPAGRYRGEIKVFKNGTHGTDGTDGTSTVNPQPATSNEQPATRNQKQATGETLGSIPVEIVVHDFELPHPKCYKDPAKDFLVSFYAYISLGDLMDANGGDRTLALRQQEAIFRDWARHNQSMHMISAGFSPEQRATVEAMRKGGLRTDVLMTCDGIGYESVPEKLNANAKRLAGMYDRAYGHHDCYMMWGDEPGVHWFPPVVPGLVEYQKHGFKHLMAGTWAVYQAAGFVYDWANISQRPDENRLLSQWNNAGVDRVAWYANHHVGTENPSLNRRQNGLAPWLAGYTCFCNYAQGLGSYNDDSQYYKQMVYTYGTGDGVLDTIAWEGFREGLDDIRYGTLLEQLAAKAAKSPDAEVRVLGRKARMVLASFQGDFDDMSACRAEMTRYIEELLKSVKADPIRTFPEAKPTPDAADDKAFADAAKPLVDAWRAAKAAGEKRNTRIALRDFCSARGRMEEFHKLTDDKIAMAEDACDFDRANALRIAALRARKGELNERRDFLWTVLPEDPALGRDPANAALFTNDSRTNNVVNDIWNTLTRRLELQTAKGYPAITWFYELAAGMADRIGKKDFAAATAFVVAEAYAAQGNAKGVKEVAARALANEKVKPADAYRLKLYARVFGEGVSKPLLGSREREAASVAAKFDAANAGALKPSERVAAIEQAGIIANVINDEELLRGLVDFRQTLLKPMPKKRYTVRYTDKDVCGTADWTQLGVSIDKSEYDRQFGGSTEQFITDVTTGTRRTGKSGEEIPNTVMQVVADAWGLHFRFENRDPKARAVELGTVPGGSFETYLAPGKNMPYVCFFMTDGEDKLGIFNTQYASIGNREIDPKDASKSRVRTVFTDDAIITYVSFSWENYTECVPKDGSVWDFENMRWDRAGGNAWNGTKTIHGRSRWGELVFEMPDHARATILKRVASKALAEFTREVRGGDGNRYYGYLRRWSDPFTGDRAFFEARLKPWSENLLERGKTLTDTASDADVFALEADGSISAWRNVRLLTDRMRYDWLTR